MQQHGLESQWLKGRLFLSVNAVRTGVHGQDQATPGALFPSVKAYLLACGVNVVVCNTAVGSVSVCYYSVCET